MTSEPIEAAEIGQPAAPRYALAWAMLICALAALTLAYPALSGGFLVNTHSDQYIAGYAFRDYAAQMLRETGSFPLWNPYLFGGMPYVDAMHGDIFYPTFLLRMLLPTDVAMTWGMILHFWLAGVATYAFLRANNLSFHASLIGGLAYMMSGQVAGLVSPGHDGKLFITALFPVTLLVLRHGVRGGKPWAWGVLGLVVGLGVLTPHPQLLQYLLIGGGAYALWMAYLEKGDGAPTPRVATQRLAFALGAVMIGFAIGAVQFMPLAQYTPWSPRADGAGWEHAISYSMPPEELVNWIIPQFSGVLDNYWGRNGIHFHSEYIGVPALLLAAAAFATRDAQHRRFMWFLTGMVGVSAIWSMGGFIEPFYRIIYALVPGTKYFRAPSTIMFMSAFAVAALAAIGAQRMLAGQITKRLAIGAAISIGLVTLLGVTGGLTNAFEFAALANPRSPEGALQAMEMNKSAVAGGAWRMAFFAGIALALLHAAYNKALRPHVIGYLFAGLVVADLWSIERNYWLFSPRAEQVFGTDAAIDRIKADSQPGRVFTLDVRSAEAAPNDPFLNGDGMMANAVRNVAGYHGNEMGRYQDLYGGKDRHIGGVLERLAQGDAYAQLTNLRWVYTNVPSLPAGYFPRFTDLKPVLGPVRNAVGSNVWLYRLPGDNPPAWVVPAMMKVPDNDALAYLTTDFPVRSVGLFDTSSAVQGEQLTAAPAPLAITARMTRYAPGSIDIELDAPAPARSGLIVSENFYPGWSATVDGKPVTAERADYVLIGVPLPPGARKVELRFSDSAYARGKLVTLLALALGAALAIGGAVVGRRRAVA